MTILSDYISLNKLNSAFQVGELCRIFNLTVVSANGVLTFQGGDGSALAEYVVGRLFDHNLEEIEPVAPVVVPPVVPPAVQPTPAPKVDPVVVAPAVNTPVAPVVNTTVPVVNTVSDNTTK